ncbi:MAG: hypothetical protein EB161_04260 [Nitrosopumilaceae archaeon]|nr:hypothetical protein [Nitrosopumilaceae archaeon]
MNYSMFVIIGIFAVSIFASFSIANAETAAKSTSFEKTTLLEFTNNDSTPVHTVKLWLGKDAGNFKSFKAERGWTGVLTPQGVLVFTSTEPLAQGDSVKFGIKTEMDKPSVNWKTSDSQGSEISIGRAASTATKQNTQNPNDNTSVPTTDFEGAEFRIIPESPKTGDEIRLVGEKFPANLDLDFLVNGQKIDDYKTDNAGHLVGRAKIPLTIESERVELSVVDGQGHKKTVSIRIAQAPPEDITNHNTGTIKRLVVEKYESIAEPGQKVSVSGTGKPGGSVKITAKDPQGNKIYEAVAQIDNQGQWIHETTIPLDAPLGSRTVEFSDGIDTITKTLSISVSKIIRLSSSAIKYDVGDKFYFNGTAKPDQSVQVVINDPNGKEVFSDILELNGTSTFNFSYQTDQNSVEGTYAIFATQAGQTEIIRVGLDELPRPQIIAKFDKLNYASSETAKITIQGEPKSTVSILIIDPSDKVKITESVTLPLDGSKVYELKLDGYKSGVYTAVIKHTQSQAKVIFSVGLQAITGNISAQTTKKEFVPGDGILILGSTNANAILGIDLSDPDGKIIKHKDVFSDKEGKFSDGTFRIPSDGKQGHWLIKVKSGAKFADIDITVTGTVTKTFTIKTDKLSYHGGDKMVISGTGGGKSQTTKITILDSKNTEITDLTLSSTKDGSFQTLWIVESGLEPGKYTVKVQLGGQNAETTFDLQ